MFQNKYLYTIVLCIVLSYTQVFAENEVNEVENIKAIKQIEQQELSLKEKSTSEINRRYSFLSDFQIDLSSSRYDDLQINPDDYMVLYMDNSSTVVIKFKPDVAPNTVAIFKQNVRDGFYNNLGFFRFVPNYFIQGGDPTYSGYGGSGKVRDAEISDQVKFARGTVAMSNTGNLRSDDTQFFISYGAFPWLNEKYTIFGEVVAGMEYLESLRGNYGADGVLTDIIAMEKIVILSDLQKFRTIADIPEAIDTGDTSDLYQDQNVEPAEPTLSEDSPATDILPNK